MRVPEEVAEVFRELPDGYRGSVTFHFDGNGVAGSEEVKKRKFQKKEEVPDSQRRRRVIVRVLDEPREAVS